MAIEPTETSLIVAVPAAERAVARFRADLDPAASWGVPAHVTVLYPFLPPERINGAVFATLRQLFEGTRRFDVSFAEVKWFGDSVVWLKPEPDDVFRQLTAAVWQRFPEVSPFGGAYADVIPHLTIGNYAPRNALAHAAEAVAAQLPIHAAVDAVQLIAGAPEPDSWHTLREFQLGTT